MRDVQRRITVNIIVIAVIAVGLVFFAHDFFKGSDLRSNTKIEPIGNAPVMNTLTKNERTYYLVYEEESTLSNKIMAGYADVLKTIKVNYVVKPIEDARHLSVREGDYIILVAEKWRNYPNIIDQILKSAKNGANLILAYSPGNDTYFNALKAEFGITDVGKYRICKSLAVKDDILMGIKRGDVLTHAVTEDSIYDIEVTSAARVYLADENDVPLFYTLEYGKGQIGVYNGENTIERYYAGVIIGVLGSMDDGIVYPIINAGVVFIDDWPGPIRGTNEEIRNQYGMDLDGFLRYIWWPDMQELYSKYGIKYTGQFVLTYNDVQMPPFDIGKAVLDVPMYSFGQQVVKNQGEVGMHGYNHQPLWFGDYLVDDYNGYYKPWESKQDAVEALSYALEQWQQVFPNYRINTYVPPSNIIDETGIEVVKEVLGTPIIVSGLYIGEPPQVPEFDFVIQDDVIYFPRMTAGSFLDDETKIQLELGAGMYGVVSHFIHPDDVIDSERSKGYNWEQLSEEYDRMMAYITERYPFIDYMTLTDAANAMINWNALDYHVVYGNDGLTVTTNNYDKPYAMMLFSSRPIANGSGYTVQKLSSNQYYIEVSSGYIEIRYSEGN